MWNTLLNELYNSLMNPVQIVIDKPLLQKVDRVARKNAQSRSEFVREALRQALKRLEYLEAVEQERRAYQRVPTTRAELALARTSKTAALAGDDW